MPFDYYVNPSTGNDANNGTTTSTPWLTTAPADAVYLAPGQSVGYFYLGSYVLYRSPGATLDEIVLPLNLITYPLDDTGGTPPSVTTFTFTGPSGGILSSASTNFTLTPNGVYTGTITITPSGGGLSTPIVKTFSGSSTPQTFTITPTLVGPVTLTPSNNGGLTNPSVKQYATPPAAPSIGVVTSGSSMAAVPFTPNATGGSAITGYTAISSPGAIVRTGSSPIIFNSLTNGISYTFTVIATNAFGNSPESSNSNSVIPAGGSIPITYPVNRLKRYSDITLSFRNNPISGDVIHLFDEDAIKQSVQNLVMTSNFEIPFHPEIGCDVMRSLFEPLGPMTAIMITKSIQNVLNNFEPRITLLGVNVSVNVNLDGYTATIIYRIINKVDPVKISIFLTKER